MSEGGDDRARWEEGVVSSDRRISKGGQADSCGQTEHQVSGNTHGGCLGERKHTVSLHYGCNGVDRHPPNRPSPLGPTLAVYTVLDGWLGFGAARIYL